MFSGLLEYKTEKKSGSVLKILSLKFVGTKAYWSLFGRNNIIEEKSRENTKIEDKIAS